MRSIATLALLACLSVCAGTPRNVADPTLQPPACAGPRTIIGRTFLWFFEPGSAAMSARATRIATELAEFWKGHGGYFMELTGHTDAQEATASRPTLALERAQAAKATLVGLGIDRQRILTRGVGASVLLVPTDAAEAQNRFVDTRLYGVTYEHAESDTARLQCRTWVRDHCFTPSPLAHAGADACGKALTGSF